MKKKENSHRPKGTGKKKIQIQKIKKPQSRFVTFSKRRKGLFKKADDLSLTTGAHIGIVVQSPAGRFYTKGSGAPSFDSIVDRFLQSNPSSDHENNVVEQQNTMIIPSTPNVEKEIEKDQDQDLEVWMFWLDLDVESLNSEEEITLLMQKLEKFQNKVGSIMMARDKVFIDSI